jgi:uncharacterized protein (DUF58 family)
LNSAVISPVEWPAGPTSAVTAELVRSLEFTITRRLDGILHGNYQGITPGHGSEPGESRRYEPGDDVRRMDWAVTARTRELHVRDQIADRDLEGWLVVDTSAAMQWGTTSNSKSQIALAAAATIGFLTARNQNRLGAVLVAGPHLRTMPPRPGKDHVRGVLRAIADSPASHGQGRSDLAAAINRVASISKRRGFVAVIADFHGVAWRTALGGLTHRHDVLAVQISDRREADIPPIGLTTFEDPATGATREVMVTPAVQAAFAERAAAEQATRLQMLRGAGADVLELRTDADWLGQVINHVQRRRQRKTGQTVFR